MDLRKIDNMMLAIQYGIVYQLLLALESNSVQPTSGMEVQKTQKDCINAQFLELSKSYQNQTNNEWLAFQCN